MLFLLLTVMHEWQFCGAAKSVFVKLRFGPFSEVMH